jgi:hypothetical protein
MLERGKLRVRNANNEGERAIEDAETAEPLGSARVAIRWLGWLPAGTLLEVREAQDAPLVFTVRRSRMLGTRNRIVDAEGRLVGSLAGSVVVNRAGRWLAALEPDGIFRGRGGAMLARLVAATNGVEIHFADVIAFDPFAKMLLLAAALKK